jgi:hypothetical protein
VIILSCLVLTVGAGACGSSSSSTSGAASAAATPTTAGDLGRRADDGPHDGELVVGSRLQRNLQSASGPIEPAGRGRLDAEARGAGAQGAAGGSGGRVSVHRPNVRGDDESGAGDSAQRRREPASQPRRRRPRDDRRAQPRGSPLLKAASAFHPLRRATIGGQSVYVYRGSFAPSDLSKLGLSGKLAKQTAAKLRQLGATRETVTSYVTSDVVARRTIAAIYKGPALLTVSINRSLRLSRPVKVSPPRASKTIPYSKLAG